MPHTLILLRHAKSDYPGGVMDHDRPLSERGVREAEYVGQELEQRCPPISAVLCSTALRTRQTLAGTGVPAPVEYRSELYEASPGEILAVISEVDEAVATLLVVGHAPGMPSTTLALAEGYTEFSDGVLADVPARELPELGHASHLDYPALEAVNRHFPTSAFAVLAVPSTWRDLSFTGARLADFVVARG